jgi:hypothetical protein
MKFVGRMRQAASQLALLALVAVMTSFGAVQSAFAQGGGAAVTFDPAPVIAIVNEATTFVTTIGLAVLIFLMVAKGIKWARKAG